MRPGVVERATWCRCTADRSDQSKHADDKGTRSTTAHEHSDKSTQGNHKRQSEIWGEKKKNFLVGVACFQAAGKGRKKKKEIPLHFNAFQMVMSFYFWKCSHTSDA